MKISKGTVSMDIMQARLAVLCDDMRRGRVSAIAIVTITQNEGSESRIEQGKQGLGPEIWSRIEAYIGGPA